METLSLCQWTAVIILVVVGREAVGSGGRELQSDTISVLRVHPPAVWHQRFACLFFENWVKEFHSPLQMPSSIWKEPVDQSPKPVFGGRTYRFLKRMKSLPLPRH